ncbi:cysteine desulfurase family protein [Rhizosaccharibacter radicis]|uniref:Cysteine desulfurase n=1 Tax=Rhizosaccharibacter radicis TaxID=2782605 RepID=A0ABT1VZJ2_9PROT|nr:aminotransferase class V-fold PLP-dependent enzyme [Acetobacteraceae bacterium KSS12]
MIYLDANASEPLRAEAREAVLAALELPGNPASVHGAGRRARDLLEGARERIAGAVGVEPAGVVLCSGGTEANVLALRALSAPSDGPRRRVLAGSTEHAAVLEAGPAPRVLPVDRDGVIRLDALERALADDGEEPALVCLMLANNETGVIHPVAEAAAICRRHGALLHVDAVQAVGRIPVTLDALGADSLALSGHKIGGPKGAGALALRTVRRLDPLLAGGGQERGRRGGTPALPAVAGLAAALDAAGAALADRETLAGWRDRIEAAARECGAVVAGEGAPRLDNTSCLALPGRRADGQLIALDLAGFCVSAGAACSSGKVARSHVLDAMGLEELAEQSVRVSLPWSATQAGVEAFIAAYRRMAARPPRVA